MKRRKIRKPPTGFVEPLKYIPCESLQKFGVADFETFFYRKRHYVYSIGFYYYDTYYSWFLLENLGGYNGLTQEENLASLTDNEIIEISYKMVLDFVFLLKTSVDPSHPVYMHNLSGFDGPLILSALNWELGQNVIAPDYTDEEKPYELTYRNGVIYQITVENLDFVDSLLLLTQSLDKLQQAFLPNGRKKGTYDIHLFQMNEQIDAQKLFDLRPVIEEYMKTDVLLLGEIILEAQLFFNSLFSYMDITQRLTISSISLAIFRTSFMEPRSIATLGQNEDGFIRQAYFGGCVDVFKPYGKNLYLYDVNALYSFAMLSDLPAGKPKFKTFEAGELFTVDSSFELYGFFRVEITYYGPAEPILPVRYKGVTVFPKGRWTGTYYSEELRLAASLGYQIVLVKGYIFKRKKICKRYVDSLYPLRINSDQPAIKFIVKLMLNSLYGRFGMQKVSNEFKLLTSSQYKLVELYHPIIDAQPIEYPADSLVPEQDRFISVAYNKRLLLGVEQREGVCENTLSDKRFEFNCEIGNMSISVALAAAITSTSRIHIYGFKNLEGNKAYYSDTDSVFLEKPLDPKYVDQTRLGAFKCEGKNAECIFLAPKIYAVKQTRNGVEELTVKFKGVPKSIVKTLTFDFFRDKLNSMSSESSKVDYFQFVRESSFIKRIMGSKVGVFFQTRVINNTFKFSKREKIYSNGKWIDTKPLTIDLITGSESTKKSSLSPLIEAQKRRFKELVRDDLI